jgi:hypothetical protein
MVFILIEDALDINIVKMMIGSMIKGDFTENLKNIGRCQNRHKKYVS